MGGLVQPSGPRPTASVLRSVIGLVLGLVLGLVQLVVRLLTKGNPLYLTIDQLARDEPTGRGSPTIGSRSTNNKD